MTLGCSSHLCFRLKWAQTRLAPFWASVTPILYSITHLFYWVLIFFFSPSPTRPLLYLLCPRGLGQALLTPIPLLCRFPPSEFCFQRIDFPIVDILQRQKSKVYKDEPRRLGLFLPPVFPSSINYHIIEQAGIVLRRAGLKFRRLDVPEG